MSSLTQWIHDLTGITAAVQLKIFATVFMIVVLWLARKFLTIAVWKRTDDVQFRYRWRKTISYTTVTLGFLLLFRLWFEGGQSLITILGFLAAGIAIALQDLVKSFAGWIFLLWRRPFAVGDRIQVGSYMGDVIDIRVFKFTLLEIGNWVDADQSTGRVMHMPNSLVLTEVIANFGQGFQFIWNEIPVLVTFESSWEKAKDILLRIAHDRAEHLSKSAEKKIKEASKQFMIFYKTITPAVFTSVKDNGVLLTIRYLIEPRKRRTSEQEIWEDILREFSTCDDIDFAYPTRRIYNNANEGKEGLKPQV